MSRGKQVPAVEKMINILQLFANSPSVYLGITDIARALNYPKSSVHGILNTLLTHDFVIQSKFNEEYALGPAMTFVSDAYFRHEEIASAFDKVLEIGSKDVPLKAAMSCSILKREKLNVVSFIPPKTMCMNLFIPNGTIISPLICSAGKLLLSRFSDREIEKAYKLQVEEMTLQLLEPIPSLLKDIDQIRRRGYSVSENEFGLNVCGVSYALTNSDEKAEAAITLYLTQDEYITSDLPKYSKIITETISSMLDYLSTDARNIRYFIGEE